MCDSYSCVLILTHSARQSGISSSPRFMTDFHSRCIVSFMGVLSPLPGQQKVKLEKGYFLSDICPSLLELPCHVLEIYFPLMQRTGWFYGKEQQRDCVSFHGLWKGSLGLLRIGPSACGGLWFESLQFAMVVSRCNQEESDTFKSKLHSF